MLLFLVNSLKNDTSFSDPSSKSASFGILSKKSVFVSDLYFYARDEKTLQLCSLMLSNVRRVDKLVVKSDIDK